MPWLLRLAVAYVAVLFAVLIGAAYVSRSFPIYKDVPISVSGQYEIVVMRYAPIPFVNGGGRAPGEVRLIDGAGRVLDSERVDNVVSVHGVQWDLPHVRFTYYRDGKFFQGDLTLEPI